MSEGLEAYCETRRQIDMWKMFLLRCSESHRRIALREIARLNQIATTIYRHEFQSWADGRVPTNNRMDSAIHSGAAGIKARPEAHQSHCNTRQGGVGS